MTQNGSTRKTRWRSKRAIANPPQPTEERVEDGNIDLTDPDDIAADNAWREKMKKIVPEVLWNPEHPDRQKAT